MEEVTSELNSEEPHTGFSQGISQQMPSQGFPLMKLIWDYQHNAYVQKQHIYSKIASHMADFYINFKLQYYHKVKGKYF